MAESINISPLPALNTPNRRDGRFRIPLTVGNPTPEQMRKLELEKELSEQRKKEEELRRYYGDTSYNSPFNLAIAAQKRTAASPFIPTTPDEKAAYPLALQNQTSFPSSAAAYMRERQLEREQAARGLLNEMSPARVTNFGLKTGNAAGDNNRERSFLERMAQSGLLSTLQGMARAERQYGVGPLAAFSESALDVQAARSAAQQEAAKRQSEESNRQAKILAEQIKKSGPAKLTATIDKRLTSFRNNSQALNTINRYLTILTSGQTGGIAGKMDKGVDALASLVGLGSGSQASKAEAARSLLLSTISSLKQTEGQISRYDYEEIENYLNKPDSWFINNEKIANQLRNLRPVIQRTLSQDATLIRESGRDPSQFSGYNNIRLSTPGRTVTE